MIGKMKEEAKGKIINEYVGLKSKMYSLAMVDNEEIKKAKGINKNVVKSISQGLIRHKMKNIQSRLHKIGTYDICKIYLSCFDDKRYILDDGISSFTSNDCIN